MEKAMQREELFTFLKTRLRLDTRGIEDTSPLFSSGVLDSFSLVDLVGFVEQSLGRRMKATEINLNNLDTVERIMRFAARPGGS
jgi:acyl carrier protein